MIDKKRMTVLATLTVVVLGLGTLTGTLTGSCDFEPSPPGDAGPVADAGGPPPPDASAPGEPDGSVTPLPPDAAPPAPDAGSPGDPDASAPPPPPDAGTPPPPPPGSTRVRIRPTVPSSEISVVSFALPLPPGTLRDVSKLRVSTTDGTEVPAYVASLGDYRTIPPAELLCEGVSPAFPGFRSVLIQFPHAFAGQGDLTVDVTFGQDGQRLADRVPVPATMAPVSDGRLYHGWEGASQPKTLALIDRTWLACSGLSTAVGLSESTPAHAAYDAARRNFFYTATADYRSVWTAPRGSWPVNETPVAARLRFANGPYSGLGGTTLVLSVDRGPDVTVTFGELPPSATASQAAAAFGNQPGLRTLVEGSALAIESTTTGFGSRVVVNGGSAMAPLRSFAWHTACGRVNPHPDLCASEDGPWLYKRGQTFVNLYAATGLEDALVAGYHALTHYRELIFSDRDCEGIADQSWCRGFFFPKDPNRSQAYKDVKYSYGEELATLYYLTGDETVVPFLTWVNDATRRSMPNLGWTERNQTAALEAPLFRYEVTGDPAALAEARAIVDGLVERSTRNDSSGVAPGCWLGNVEWGADGFSPWMSNLLMYAVLRYYYDTGDDRVPPMMTRVSRCVRDRGMARTSAIQGTEMTVPFYGALTTGPLQDLENDPWQGVEHARDVAQVLTFGLLFETDPQQEALTRAKVAELMVSAVWAYTNWTRNTAGLPRYRTAPFRKYMWWEKNGGVMDFEASRPRIGP